MLRLTSEPPIKVRVGGHLEAGVRQQEAADVGEAGVDVFPDVLQLLVLVLLHLNADVSRLTAEKNPKNSKSRRLKPTCSRFSRKPLPPSRPYGCS